MATGKTLNKKQYMSTIDSLPAEILQDILSRLPLTSLFQTYWHSLSLANDRCFSKLHYTHQSLVQNPNHTSFIYGQIPDLWYIPDMETTEIAIKLNNLPSHLRSLQIMASLNGFLCLVDQISCVKQIVICNPVNGDCFNLPGVGNAFEWWSSFGFGCTPNYKQYKAVLKKTLSVIVPQGLKLSLQILTLGSNSWRPIGIESNLTCGRGSTGIFFHGYLHCFIYKSYYDETIVSIKRFSLEDERFGVVSVPDAINGKMAPSRLQLGVLGGCLSISLRDSVWKVWIMKNYSVKESWVLGLVFWSFVITKSQPFAVQKNGNLLVEDFAGRLLSYNPKTGKNKLFIIVAPYIKSADVLAPFPHVGTLVTLQDLFAMENT